MVQELDKYNFRPSTSVASALFKTLNIATKEFYNYVIDFSEIK